jgi:hypothetical protein
MKITHVYMLRTIEGYAAGYRPITRAWKGTFKKLKFMGLVKGKVHYRLTDKGRKVLEEELAIRALAND